MVLTWLFYSCILFPPNFMLDHTVLAAKNEIQVATDCNNFEEEFAVQQSFGSDTRIQKYKTK